MSFLLTSWLACLPSVYTCLYRDYNVISFPGYEHPEWAGKKELASLARESFKGKTKAIAVYTGAFLDLLFTPFGTSQSFRSRRMS